MRKKNMKIDAIRIREILDNHVNMIIAELEDATQTEADKSKSGSHTFACTNCGTHELTCVYEISVSKYYKSWLTCTCNESDMNNAAEFYCHNDGTINFMEFGKFNKEGEWEVEDPDYDIDEDYCEGFEVLDEYHSNCQECVRTRDYCWKTKELAVEESDEKQSEKVYYCTHCGQEYRKKGKGLVKTRDGF